MTMDQTGALGFGLVIGWFLYFLNRYRTSEASFTDLTTVIGAVGGAAVTRLFGEGGALFGAYGIGLAIGFFTYFVVLVVMVGMSRNFGVDYFLDGRRKSLGIDEQIPGYVRQPNYSSDEDGTPPAVQTAIAAGVAAAMAVKQP